MCIKGNINIIVYRVYYHLKSLGVLFFLPIVAVNVVLPLLTVFAIKNEINSIILTEKIRSYFFMIVPVFSNWWSTLILKEYLEGNGNELLFVKKKSKFMDVFIVFFLYLCDISVVFLIYSCFFDSLWLSFVWLYVICFFLFAVAYFVSFLFRSMTVTLMLSLIYILSNHIIVSYNEIMFLFSTAMGKTFNSEFFRVYLPMVIASVIFVILGLKINKKICRYN